VQERHLLSLLSIQCMSRRDLSVKGGTSERWYRTRRGRTDEQRYAIISPYFDGRIKMNGPYPEITVFIWYMYIQLIGLKKCRILITVLTLRNRPSIVIKEGGGRIMAQLFILSYSDANI
jgi:hypothetical protein